MMLMPTYSFVVNQGPDEDDRRQNVHDRRGPCIVRRVVRRDHDVPDVNHTCAKPPNRERDHCGDPEVFPYPVAKDPQHTDG